MTILAPMLHEDGHDYSGMTWSAAYAALCACLKREYVFTHWKALDWDSLQARFASQIKDAENVSSRHGYYRALREFLYAIPDANLRLWGDSWELHQEEVNGSYGFSVTRLQDGQVRVSRVVPNGAAARADIYPGAQVLSWNGLPIGTALNGTKVLWADHPPGTRIQHDAMQSRFLTLAPVGSVARVEVQNPGRSVRLVQVVAEECPTDECGSGSRTWHSQSPIRHDMLPAGVGLIVIRSLPEESRPASLHSAIFDYWRAALPSFVREHASGLVLDLRGCSGGNHGLAVRLAGFFYRHPLFYATAGYQAESFSQTGKLKRDPRTLLQIIPQEFYWNFPVATIINSDTMGAAEGLASAIQHTPQGIIVGSSASGGAFGPLTTKGTRQVWLPEGYNITFSIEAGLNQDGVVQIESNRFGEGGVQPGVRVPRDMSMFQAQYIQGHDVELIAAQQALARASRGG